MHVSKRTLKQITRLVENAKSKAELRTAVFGSKEETQKIRDAVRIHHASWIVGPLEEALELLASITK